MSDVNESVFLNNGLMDDDEILEIPVIWVGAEDAPVTASNQFVSSFEPEQFVLTFGNATPPIIVGTDEQKQEQLKRLGYVPIRTLARFSLTPHRLEELIAILAENLENYRKMFGGDEPPR
jgi:hypothetical protein